MEEEPDLAVKYSKLLATLATEVLEAWKKVENSVLSMAAVGLAVDEEASSEAGAACTAAGGCWGLSDEEPRRRNSSCPLSASSAFPRHSTGTRARMRSGTSSDLPFRV